MRSRSALVVALILLLLGAHSLRVAADPPPQATSAAVDGGAADGGAAALAADAGRAVVVSPVAKRPLFVSESAMPKIDNAYLLPDSAVSGKSATAPPPRPRWWIGVVVAASLGVVFAVAITAVTLGDRSAPSPFSGNVSPGLEQVP